MRFRILHSLPLFIFFISGCTSDQKDIPESISWISPEAGISVNLGEKVKLEVKLSDTPIDSIVYYSDGLRLQKSLDQKPVTISTDSLALGLRAITAKVYKSGSEPQEASINIVLKSTLIPKKFSFKVEKVFNHDITSYTQGLEFHNGFFYESDGGNSPETGYSSLRRVEPSSGKVLQKIDLPHNIFGEGLTLVNDKIILLTWQNNMGMVYDKNTFEKLSEFSYQNSREGWGLCSDGKQIYKSDGTNQIYFLNRQNYTEEGYIEVYDQNGPVDQLNELEFIDGKIYANVYTTDRIVIINPQNGQVTGEIDMTGLFPSPNPEADVLNGIAWDNKGKRLFVTGKRWAKLFQVELRIKGTFALSS